MGTKYYTFEGTICVNGVWEPEILETEHSYSYGDFQEYSGEVTEALKKSLFIIPDLFTGSDYAGGSVQKSNHRSFLHLFKKVEGVYDLYGGFSTYAIAIRADVAESNLEIKDTLDALEDYPLIDEEDHSELEIDWQGEAMPYILDDLIRILDLEEYIPEIDTILEDRETLEYIVWDGINELNLDWLSEYTGVYLNNSEKLIPYVEDKLLINHCKDLPLLISRDWSCLKMENEFKEKLSKLEVTSG